MATESLELSVMAATDWPDLPTNDQFQTWAEAVLDDAHMACSLDIRIVDEDESRALNDRFRGKDRPTNVLSFPSGLSAHMAGEIGYLPLGDLAICAPLVTTEADEQGRPLADHWAHLTVHGILHLLGHDHEVEEEAEAMEELERKILAGFGISDPYLPIQGA